MALGLFLGLMCILAIATDAPSAMVYGLLILCWLSVLSSMR